MARTTQQIYDALIAEKNSNATLNALQPNIDNAQNLLTDLTSPSKVAIWRLYYWVVAVVLHNFEVLMDVYKEMVEDIAAKSRPGTVRWYQEETLKFQFGHQLIYNPAKGKYEYPANDETSKIVKRSAVVESNNQVRIKAAKFDGGVQQLLPAEMNALTAYWNKLKYAGVNTVVTSGPADLLKVNYTVYYDPLVMAANGSLLSDPAVFPVRDAINTYIGSLPFNGELVLTKLTDEVQKAKGVVDPILNSAEARYGALMYSPILTKYIPDAGYMEIDQNFPLSNSITYIANV
jgi:hypothetical protein